MKSQYPQTLRKLALGARRILAVLNLLALSVFTQSTALAVDNDLLAHRLYSQGDYASAAEIFVDPAWKGVALYRSSQWWRAAEAFVRANDAQSAFNLGNCYVKLGYYALALDAYQRALSIDPELNDAAVNADIMRQLLIEDDEDSEQGGRQPSGDEIDRLQNDVEREAGAGEGGEDSESAGKSSPGGSNNTGNDSGNSAEQAEAGDGSELSERESEDQQGENGSGAVNGQESETDVKSQPSGGSESDQPSDASQAAGLRAELESEQATEQWLNRIQHDPQRYLEKRIQLEDRRRRAAGQSAPEGGSTW